MAFCCFWSCFVLGMRSSGARRLHMLSACREACFPDCCYTMEGPTLKTPSSVLKDKRWKSIWRVSAAPPHVFPLWECRSRVPGASSTGDGLWSPTFSFWGWLTETQWPPEKEGEGQGRLCALGHDSVWKRNPGWQAPTKEHPPQNCPERQALCHGLMLFSTNSR